MFSAEIGCMGHGLQMWLQTMWFLARASENSTVILDEPDVYMHADLQRKLIRMLIQHYSQVIVATHSIEIMAEVNPNSILVVDKNSENSQYATDLPGVQNIIDNIGSIQNIGLARLWSSKKLLLVEGKDIQLLKRIQNTLFPKSEEPLDAIPNSKIGGWGGWNLVKGADLVIKNGMKQHIKTYCILDSDYYPESEIEARLKEAKKANINLHIWTKKEIENYLICPEALFRILERENLTAKVVSLKEVKSKIENICESLKDSVLDNISDRIHNSNKKYTPSKANSEARKIVNQKWSDKESLVSGKAVLKKFRLWSQTKFNVSFSDLAVAQEIRKEEIHPELVNILSGIEKCKSFN
jgi:predicted ATP-dependent endonuclease of OLD family